MHDATIKGLVLYLIITKCYYISLEYLKDDIALISREKRNEAAVVARAVGPRWETLAGNFSTNHFYSVRLHFH